MSFCGGKICSEVKAELYCVKLKHWAGVRLTAVSKAGSVEIASNISRARSER